MLHSVLVTYSTDVLIEVAIVCIRLVICLMFTYVIIVVICMHSCSMCVSEVFLCTFMCV